VIACVATAIAFAADGKGWFAAVPADKQDALSKRLEGYVKAHRARDWG
jgi:hypothetical protein